MTDTTILAARKIITMNPNRPEATHVAIRDGRILGAGTLDELAGWGEHTLDDRFADKVLMPGFVEGHSHLMEGSIWKYAYCGYMPRIGPDGTRYDGLESIEAVVEWLKRCEAKMTDPDTPLVGWGFDPIYFGGRRMVKEDLDAVSTTRPIVVIHSNFHLVSVNSLLLQRSNITAATNVDGIAKGPDGEPNGELQEMAAKFMALNTIGLNYAAETAEAQGLRNFANIAVRTGTTTATDLVNTLTDDILATLLSVTGADDYPVRLVPAFHGDSLPPAEGAARAIALRKKTTDKLKLGIVKLVTDGSIQGFTGRLRWPGYYNGAANGVWNVGPDRLEAVVTAYHDAGCQVFIHTNGDEAIEVAIDAVEAVTRRNPWGDHRHTLQHCQMADAAQFRRMASLGMCANLFANHLYYWGDQHYAVTMGPDRANRMDGCATAMSSGVPFAIHSDAPVTPLGPLFTAWCAVNRTTVSGRVLGEAERISVADALRAITLGAAYTLKLDDEIGSVEVGKRADFAVLDEDPLGVAPEALKDVPVWGTVVGGQAFQA